MIRTLALEADVATIPGYVGAATVVAIPPTDTGPAPFMILVYVNGQPMIRGFDRAMPQP